MPNNAGVWPRYNGMYVLSVTVTASCISLSRLWLWFRLRPPRGRGPAFFGAAYSKKTSTGATPSKHACCVHGAVFPAMPDFPPQGRSLPCHRSLREGN